MKAIIRYTLVSVLAGIPAAPLYGMTQASKQLGPRVRWLPSKDLRTAQSAGTQPTTIVQQRKTIRHTPYSSSSLLTTPLPTTPSFVWPLSMSVDNAIPRSIEKQSWHLTKEESSKIRKYVFADALKESGIADITIPIEWWPILLQIISALTALINYLKEKQKEYEQLIQSDQEWLTYEATTQQMKQDYLIKAEKEENDKLIIIIAESIAPIKDSITLALNIITGKTEPMSSKQALIDNLKQYKDVQSLSYRSFYQSYCIKPIENQLNTYKEEHHKIAPRFFDFLNPAWYRSERKKNYEALGNKIKLLNVLLSDKGLKNKQTELISSLEKTFKLSQERIDAIKSDLQHTPQKRIPTLPQKPAIPTPEPKSLMFQY